MENLLRTFDWIKAIYKTGSAILPWIADPRDEDYVFLVDEEQATIPRKAELYDLRPINTTWVCTSRPYLSKEIIAYECHFVKLLAGENSAELYDIFKNEAEYKQTLVKTGLSANLERTQTWKFWYHILTGIYMLENGKYELTEEQIANVRLCHARKMTEEIYEFIQSKLAEYKAQLNS